MHLFRPAELNHREWIQSSQEELQSCSCRHAFKPRYFKTGNNPGPPGGNVYAPPASGTITFKGTQSHRNTWQTVHQQICRFAQLVENQWYVHAASPCTTMPQKSWESCGQRKRWSLPLITSVKPGPCQWDRRNFHPWGDNGERFNIARTVSVQNNYWTAGNKVDRSI